MESELTELSSLLVKVNVPTSDVEPMQEPQRHRGSSLGGVPVRVLLVFMVLVPWGGLAYRTADRIDHDQGELNFTDRLAPAAIRVKRHARLERQLQAEGGAAALKIAARTSGYPLELAEAMTGVPIRENLARSRTEVDRLLAALRRPGLQLNELGAVRARFDSPTMADPFDSGYAELRAENREALDKSLRELWVLAAQLGADKELEANLQSLGWSVEATRAAVDEANLLLNRSSGSSFDEFGVGLIRESHRATHRPIQAIANLGSTPAASAAKRLLQTDAEATIEKESSRPVDMRPRNLDELLSGTRTLYPLLAGRNVQLGKISDLAANDVAARAKMLVDDQRSTITDTMIWLFASLITTLTVATLVGRSISRPLRRLGQQARSLVSGNDQLQPITPSGPRELIVSALALNELATTLVAVQQQADALAAGHLDTAIQSDIPPSRLGSSVQLAVQRLSESIQLNNRLRDDFEHAANHDALTGLPNRMAIYRSLEQHLAADTKVGLLFVDLDHFKQVNDKHGHDAGDEVLRTMAGRFIECASPTDVVARLGGDEFIIVCTGATSTHEALADLGNRLRTVAAQPIDIGANSLELGASIGVAIAAPTDTATKLLRRADNELYLAKAAGRNQTSIAPAMMEEPSFTH
jgi:diguanylate cyclase (GGDEF)-like protein